MWRRFAEWLCCPTCGGRLELDPLETHRAELERSHLERAAAISVSPEQLAEAVDLGLLLCRDCRVWYPVEDGVPLLLTYPTAAHAEFSASHSDRLRRLGAGWSAPSGKPPVGETLTARSFSREWQDYAYDGVIWAWTYADREALFLAEMGASRSRPEARRFLEVGCGLGLVTSFAATHAAAEAVGVDLSQAVRAAARHFREQPFLHWVQASVWHLPFAPASFDRVYSHGVLHHTYSTEAATRAVAKQCAPGGAFYLWVYGDVATRETLSRRIAYAVEGVARPILSRLPGGLTAPLLAPFALLYMALNRAQRAGGREREAYDYRRALHAAQDRLTPRFAFHHTADEVRRWFAEAGFERLQLVTEDEVPASARETIRRNVGIRGVRSR